MNDRRTAATAGLNEQEWSILVQAVESLEEAWADAPPAQLARFVPEADDRLRQRVLVELVKVDHERRWQRGERLKVEDYLERWPELQQDAALIEELLHTECLTRAAVEELPTADELRKRFPQAAEHIDLTTIEREAENESVSPFGDGTPLTDLARSLSHGASDPGTEHQRLNERFGRYELHERIGQGAMATVYRATDTQLDRPVALKIPHFNASTDPSLIERFLREGRTAARLRHAHICPVHDADQVDGTYYIAMAFVEGMPLQQWRENHSPTPAEAVRLTRKVAAALEAVHEAGIIHRDIKPANVVIDTRGEPVLTDFGLARDVRDASQLTESDSAVGTPAYMSPEQIDAGDRQVDHRSDLYSLGAVLYFLLTGYPPFTGPVTQVLHDIGHKPPPPPKQQEPHVDDALQIICLRAIDKDPEERYQTVAEFGAALDEYLRDPSAKPATSTRPSRKHRAAMAGAVCLLLAAGAVYLTAINLKPSKDALAQKAEALIKRSAYEEAIPLFRQRVETAPDDPNRWYELAIAHLGNGDEAGYREVCAAMAKHFHETENPETGARLSYMCVVEPNALSDDDLLLSWARMAPTVWEGEARVLGAALYRAGRPEAALEQFERATSAHPRRGWDWFFLSMIHHRLGDIEQARRCFEQGRQWVEATREGERTWGWTEQIETQRLRQEAENLLSANAQSQETPAATTQDR